MTLNFNRVWASEFDRSVDYPTENQAKRGLSFLGTEAPIFELHDAIFQDEDQKAKWLYDQVRIACERFGQQVQKEDGTLISDARDTMANAITNALLTQRKADEGGHGIVRMANADQTNAGQDYNLAVSPKHLAEYVSAQNTWENTKGKPQTATRWPDYSEVTNTPVFGQAAWQGVCNTSTENVPYDTYELTTAATVAGVRDYLQKKVNDIDSSLKTISKTGNLNDGAGILDKGHGGTGRGDGSADFKSISLTQGGTLGGVRFVNADSTPSGDLVKIVSGLDDGTDINLASNLNIDTWNGLGVRCSSAGFKTVWKIDARSGTTRQRGDIKLIGHRSVSASGDLSLASDSGGALKTGSGNIQFYGKDGEVFHVYSDGSAWIKGNLSGGGLGDASRLNTTHADANNVESSEEIVANTKHIAQLKDRINHLENDCVRDIRSIFVLSRFLSPPASGIEIGANEGEFIASIAQSDEKWVYAQVRREQMYINGSWVTVKRV